MITDRARLARAMNRLFWGTLVVVLDLRINEIDIIFDPLGAWLVLSACQDVLASVQAPGERRALGLLVPLATVAFVTSFFGMFEPWVDEVVTSTLQLGGAWALARVMSEVFAGGSLGPRWAQLEGWLRWIFVITTTMQVVGLLAFREPLVFDTAQAAPTLAVVALLVVSLIGLVKLLSTLRTTETELRSEPAIPATNGWPQASDGGETPS